MLLTQARITKLGPIYHNRQLEIDPAVTILTGANDAGKSSVIRLIRTFLAGKPAEEMDINQDHLQETQRKWMEDPEPRIELDFQIESGSEMRTGSEHFLEGDSVTVGKRMAMPQSTHEYVFHSKRHGHQNWGVHLPQVLFSSGQHQVRDQIDLGAPNPLEAAMLRIGFNAPFSFDRINALSAINFTRQLRDAEERINKQMERLMPIPGALRFHLEPVEGKRQILTVFLRDRHDAMTPFGLRGTGVRKMITLLAELLTYAPDSHHRILLLDEPENSLHADAQHLLREFLYNLASSGQTQVIYATHSPCMINPMRPEQVRLLRRIVHEGKPTSSFTRQATDSNFLALRTSLGINAADSLLFAPVTIIIEGDTEFKCLALLLKKLADAGTHGFEQAAKLLSLSHFLDGMGDSFEFLCRLAKSQGTRVVLFLDGDKQRVLQQQKFQETHPDVPVILLPNKDEFEQLVPSEIYFDALAEELGEKGKGADFKVECAEWVAADDKRARRAFSKQVWGWVEERFEDATATKQTVMRKAVELTPPEKINSQPLRDLLAAINKHLQDTSF